MLGWLVAWPGWVGWVCGVGKPAISGCYFYSFPMAWFSWARAFSESLRKLLMTIRPLQENNVQHNIRREKPDMVNQPFLCPHAEDEEASY